MHYYAGMFWSGGAGAFHQEAREKLLELVGLVRELDLEMGGGHTCAADILTLYAHTSVWFFAERNYKVRLRSRSSCQN